MSLTRWFVFAGLLSVGCGKVADDSKPDALSGDANTADADERGMANIVTESALFGGTPGTVVGGIDVFSTLPNNQALATTTSDASGNATIAVYPGGTVTAVYKHTADAGADFITYVGVKPGDTLRFGNRNPTTANAPNTPLGTQTYSMPTFPGATSYAVATSCAPGGFYSGTPSVAIPETSTCHKEPMDVVMIAIDGAGNPVAYASRSNIPFVSGGTVTINSWSSAPTGTLTVTGIPSEFTSVNGHWGSVLDGQTDTQLQTFFSGTLTGGAYSTTFGFNPAGDRTFGQVSFSRPGYGQLSVFESFSTGVLAQTVAAPTFTPLQQSSVIASSGLRMASWFFVPQAGSNADAVVVRATWGRTVSGVNSAFQWYFIMPPDQLAIAFPKVPAALDSYAPAPADSMGASARIFDAAMFANYDAVRAQPSRNIMCLECAVRAGEVQHVVASGNVQ